MGPLVPVGPLFLVGGALLATSLVLAGHALGVRAARVAFWGSLAALVYVYVLYPLAALCCFG